MRQNNKKMGVRLIVSSPNRRQKVSEELSSYFRYISSVFTIFFAVCEESGAQNQAVTIPDVNLRVVIEDSLDKASGATITRAEMATLTRIDAQDANISNLAGLQYATGLTHLYLGGEWGEGGYINSNDISNLSHLSGLTGLIKLKLAGNNISDVSPLSNLTGLTEMDIQSNSISDVSPLSSLIRLTSLDLELNSISDASPLSNLTGLTSLDISRNSMSDLSPLSGLSRLKHLSLWGNSILDVSPLSNLTGLTFLELQINNILDISQLVVNMGLGSGDEVNLTGNALSYSSLNTHIPTLQGRGVLVRFDSRSPTRLAIVSGQGQDGTPGAALAAPFIVEVRDQRDEAFAGVPVAFTVTSGGGSLSNTTGTTNANGWAQTTLTLGSSTENTVEVLLKGHASVPPLTFHTGIMTLSDLEHRVSDARPGDAVTLADGIYNGDMCELVAKGSVAHPITIQAKNMGKAVIRGPLSVEGDYIHLVGLRFEREGSIEIRGRGCRISRCVMTDVQTGTWIRVHPESREIEIDRCRFENKTNNREKTGDCQLMQIFVRNQGERHHVHHNYFVDVPEGKGNGYETLQLITEGNPWDPEPGDCETLIEYNLFERCNGEGEIISIKSNGNLLRRNTFRDCRGALWLRHGDGNVVSENFFFGEGEPRAGGVLLQGTDQVVVNNSFRSLDEFGVSIVDGTSDDHYVRVERALVAFNTFVGCNPGLKVGLNDPRYPNGTAPKDCVIANNAFVSVQAEGTVRLLQGDEPVDWTWEGNVTDGDLGLHARDGIQIEQIDMDYLPNGVVAPAESSILIGNAKGHYPDITTDILGNSRGEFKTVGCVEYPVREKYGGPLTVADVGVNAVVTEVPVKSPTADFDGDGTVGFSDFSLFAAQFGLIQGDAGYDARYDLDGDGRIGLGDFLIFAGAFGK